ncbi:50S ribosomal protein L33 [Erysipelothrix inopinata]|uniref:Large ribosomal subunit protein bL33 n=1 Tax=Erysipelothrix inopinata TaxID=225084 RepID=A0A7G9RXV6_9FIRM|nr:50S ribosomal protein L33 [Erysipelothrix inopinata]QNN60431.1 50S ribosomal protein L33 [Erysipelothrix inopinata]
MRTQVILKCAECGEENYYTSRNKKVQLERMEVTKYCPRDKKHTLHKEKK